LRRTKGGHVISREGSIALTRWERNHGKSVLGNEGFQFRKTTSLEEEDLHTRERKRWTLSSNTLGHGGKSSGEKEDRGRPENVLSRKGLIVREWGARDRGTGRFSCLRQNSSPWEGGGSKNS